MNLSTEKAPEQTRVVVAMSGGVDSSTVAGLVAEAGYETIGITLQLYDHGAVIKSAKSCCAGQDIEDARRACETLDIPHYVLDYESLFKESVMDDFAESYARGETPIPCVRCNQSVKFRDLLKVAKDMDADALVTGHYVQRIDGEAGAELHNAADANKDQTYFLFATTQEQLDYVHFPLGGMTKEETRQHAQRFGLTVADKPESMDICFVPNGDYASIVQKLRPGTLDRGEIVHVDGRVLGTHEGIIHFTVGQRRRLGISTGEPLYVIRIDPEKKQVIVGPEDALLEGDFSIQDINWLGGAIPPEGREVEVKLRSMQPACKATIFPIKDGKASVRLHAPQKAITPGQACVCYDGTRVLGGGWITRDHQTDKLAA